ncbi:hypothetical protein D3C76_1013890 [compost metagenome]
MAKVAADAARDITCRWGTVIRVKADAIKVGCEAEPAVIGGIGLHVDQHVAQPTGDLEPLDHRGDPFRQWRQGVEHRREWCQVETVGLQMPDVLRLVRGRDLLQLQS